MPTLKRIVLDVLKPHQPNGLEFSRAVAGALVDCRVRLKVEGVDEKTESVVLEITGTNIDFEAVLEKIADIGGSVHSIDEVEMESEPEQS